MFGKLVGRIIKGKAEEAKNSIVSSIASGDVDANGVKDGEQLIANLKEVQEGADAIGEFVDLMQGHLADPQLAAQWKETQEAVAAIMDTALLAQAYFGKYVFKENKNA